MSASNILSLLVLASPFALASIEIDGKEYSDKLFLFLTAAFGLSILRYLYNTLTLKQFYKGAYTRLSGEKSKNLPSIESTGSDGYLTTTLKTIFLLPGIIGEQLFLPPNKTLFMLGFVLIPVIVGVSVYYNMKLENRKLPGAAGAGAAVLLALVVLVARILQGVKI